MSESTTYAEESNHNEVVHLVQIDELACLRVRHPQATALIALQGAQLLEYTPTGSRPVIWLSETAEFKGGQSVRGGIPVCWPWFGDLRRNPVDVQTCIAQQQTPAHGWVRNLPWLLERVSSNDSGVNIRLRYPLPAGIPTAWAAEAALVLTIHIGRELVLQLDTTNHSSHPLTLSQALHSYFAVSDIGQICVQPLQQLRYVDTLREWQIFSDDTPLRINGETDRIYLDTPATLTLDDDGWQRRIHIHCAESRSAVIWNPWIDKSKRLSHFPNDAYQRMICIETARVFDDCVVLAPGQTNRMTTRIWQTAL